MVEKLSLYEAIIFSMKKHKPNEDGSCKTESCDGMVVAEVNGLFRGNYTHGTPFCSRCKRSYISAVNVSVIGIEEFERLMRTPMTI